MRYGADHFEVGEDEVKLAYSLMPGVRVISRIIPKGAWHVRVHEICTEHEIDVADSGDVYKRQPPLRAFRRA